MQPPIHNRRPLMLLVLLCGCYTSVSKGNTILYTAPNVNVTTDVGYFISIDNTNPIKVTSNQASSDPLHTYQGSGTYTFESNFVAQLTTNIQPTSPAGGIWSASATPSIVGIGTTVVTIKVNVQHLDVLKLVGGTAEVKIAELTISVLPATS